MQLTFLFLIFGPINVTHAMLHDVISTSSYSVLLEKTIDQVYYGTTAISTHNRTTLTTVECAGICERAPGCGGFNFCHILGNRTCEAMTANQEPLDTTRDFRWTLGCFYFHKALVSLQFCFPACLLRVLVSTLKKSYKRPLFKLIFNL